MHTLEAFYNDGTKNSVMNAEMTFVAEKGHTVYPVGWPPTLTDQQSGAAVKQHLRPAPR